MSATRSEAEGNPLDVEYLGVPFPIPPMAEVDLDVMQAMETGRLAVAVRQILGDDWDTFQDAFVKEHGRKLKSKDVAPMMDVIAVAYGFKSTGE